MQVSGKPGRGSKSKVKPNCRTKMQTEKEQDRSGAQVAIKLEDQVKSDPDEAEERPLDDIQQSNGHDSSNPAGRSAFRKHIFFFN